jgi:hypothetical protein
MALFQPALSTNLPCRGQECMLCTISKGIKVGEIRSARQLLIPGFPINYIVRKYVSVFPCVCVYCPPVRDCGCVGRDGVTLACCLLLR